MTLQPCVNLRTLGYHTTGVQRYLRGLLPYLPSELEPIKPRRALQGIKGHLWEQLYLPTRLGHRLLWSPGNTGPITVSRQVLTVHDASSLDHPEWFDRKFALWYSALLPPLIRKVRAIITVSDFSKERIIRLTGVKPDRVRMICNGVDDRFRPVNPPRIEQVSADYGLDGPYLLFVGSLEPRKNLRALLEAWRGGGFDGATLAVVGARGHLFPKMQFDSLPAGVRLLGRVEDDVLPALYSGATGFVYPSIYEGFGMPPLEAMACGCPVAVSDIPAHREVCGEAALYFDPFNVEEISARLGSLLRLGGTPRGPMVQQGLLRAARFSWKDAAGETWRTLELAAYG